MGGGIEQIGYWLGSHALAFFALATAIVFATLGLLWFALITHIETLSRWASRLRDRLARKKAVARLLARLSALGWISAYLTAYAVVAFGAALAALFVFVEIAEGTQAGERIAIFDAAFTAGVRDSTSRSILQVFHTATHLGDPPFLLAVVVIVATLLLWRRRRLLALAWVLATGGNGLLTRVLKAVFERTRPIHEHGLVVYEGWSFPSGHASASFAVYAMLVYVVLRGREPRWWHLPAVFAATALILVVGSSRVFLQVHYLSDVVAGYLVAASWLCLCIAGAETARAQLVRLRGRRGATDRDT